MKKLILLLLLSIISLYANSDSICIKKASFKEIFYILEKNGYTITYNINYDNLKYIFNKKLKFNTLKELSLKELLDDLSKNKDFTYKLKDKKIEFYKKMKKINRNKNKINKYPKYKNNINKIVINIKNNKDIDKYKKILIRKFLNKKIIPVELNYYNKKFNIFITKNSYSELLDNLKININKDLDLRENKIQSKKNLEKNLKNIEKYILKQKKIIKDIVKNIKNISYNYYPYINSYIKYHNKDYYFIGNINYKDNLSKLKNNKELLYLFNKDEEFKYFDFKCKILNNSIVCSNKNNIFLIK